MNHRKIIHIDMDAFFASVEQRDNPELRGKPVAVGGSGRRGVVAAASYEARVFGVRSAMPGFKAKELCPHLIFAKHRFDVYTQVSYQIREIFAEYTDLIEPLSLDEAFLDVTENKKGMSSATLIAQEIRARIKTETQLNASAGISINKFLAKIASDLNKPNGQALIGPDEALSFLEKLPIEKFFGIGKATANKMHRLGIRNGMDLKSKTKIELASWFGKPGIWYYHIVRAEDFRPVRADRIRKSVGAERTFNEDIDSVDDMIEVILPIVDTVYERLQRIGRFGRTLSIKVKYKDFTSITRSTTFTSEVGDKSVLIEAAEKLVKDNIQIGDEVRLLGVTVSNLSGKDMEGEQIEIPFPGLLSLL
jgi:DNA polymerase-4